MVELMGALRACLPVVILTVRGRTILSRKKTRWQRSKRISHPHLESVGISNQPTAMHRRGSDSEDAHEIDCCHQRY